MKKKIYLYLSGGLGNQLFQYAAAKNLSIINQADLIIDTYLGFVTDFKDRRIFSLEKKRIHNVFLKKLIWFFLFYRIYKKIFKLKKAFNNLFFSHLIDEMTINYYDENIKQFKIKRKLYLFGYFQSEKYFIENKFNIIKEITPLASYKRKYSKVAKNISDNNSVAVCVRLHETLPKELQHTAGGIVYFNFYKKALNVILKKIKNPNFFFFSTKSEYIKNLLDGVDEFKKYSHKIITPQEGFKDDIDTLWLLSCFKNLVISNSTYYWWGAYFSREKFPKQLVISSKKFPNRDTNLKNWVVL